MSKVNTFNFERLDIKKYADTIEDVSRRIEYLQKIKDEYRLNPPQLDVNIRKHPTFEECMDIFIEQLKREVEKDRGDEKSSSSKLEDMIWWKGTEGQLIYLFEQLLKNNLVENVFEEKKHNLLSKHFKNKNGKQFKPKQMSQAMQNLLLNKSGKPKKADLLEEIALNTKKE